MTAPISQGGERRVLQEQPERYLEVEGEDRRTGQRRVAHSKRKLVGWLLDQGAEGSACRMAALEIILALRSHPHVAQAWTEEKLAEAIYAAWDASRVSISFLEMADIAACVALSRQPREGVCVARGRITCTPYSKGVDQFLELDGASHGNDDIKLFDDGMFIFRDVSALDGHRVSVWIVEEKGE